MVYQLVYTDYIDKSTGKTLVVTPGSAYTIAVAPGRVASTPAFPNDGRWTSVANFVAMDVQVEPRAESPAAPTASPASDTLKTVGSVAVAPADSDKPKEGA
jgi:hypothetical protein